MSAVKYDEGRLMAVLVAPIVSEKATMVAEKNNSVTFRVLQNATKPEIKAAVELMFKVEVKGVSVVNIKGKSKRFGRSMGRRDNIRKAYVTAKALALAFDIDHGNALDLNLEHQFNGRFDLGLGGVLQHAEGDRVVFLSDHGGFFRHDGGNQHRHQAPFVIFHCAHANISLS